MSYVCYRQREWYRVKLSRVPVVVDYERRAPCDHRHLRRRPVVGRCIARGVVGMNVGSAGDTDG